jgi:hypothetical protein
MEIFGCQECSTLELVNPNVRILSNQSTIGNEIPVSRAQVKVYQTKKISPSREPRQRLSCLAHYEIGKTIWSGKTNEEGVIHLERIPPGRYWIAIKSKTEHAVYLVILPPDRKPAEPPVILHVSDIGLVLNKCDIEPIKYFFH